MSRKRKLLILFIALILLVGVYFIFIKKDKPNSSGTTPSNAEVEENTQPAATITYTDSGFQPSTTTIKPGQLVKIANNSSKDLQLESSDEKELNIGYIARGDSRSVVLTHEGTWTFNNNLSDTDEGTVTVTNTPPTAPASQ